MKIQILNISDLELQRLISDIGTARLIAAIRDFYRDASPYRTDNYYNEIADKLDELKELLGKEDV